MINIAYGSGLQVFGNSIAAGGNASVGAGYVNRIAGWIGGSVESKAVSGTGVRSITEQGNLYLPYGARSKLVTWDGPLNDIRVGGVDALACIGPSLNAFLSSAFMAGGRAANNAQVIRSGTWSNFTDYGGRAQVIGTGGPAPLQSTDAAAYLTYITPVTKTVSVHSFLTEATGTLRDLDIEIDGVHYALELSGKARLGDVACGAALFVHGLAETAHSMVIRAGSSGTKTVVDCIGWPYLPGMAPVIVGHTPYLKIWNAFSSVLNDNPASPNYGPSVADQANAIIDSVVADWKTAGFPVEVARVNDFYHADTDCGPDGVHPLNMGHVNYSTAYITQIHVI